MVRGLDMRPLGTTARILVNLLMATQQRQMSLSPRRRESHGSAHLLHFPFAALSHTVIVDISSHVSFTLKCVIRCKVPGGGLRPFQSLRRPISSEAVDWSAVLW